MRQTDYSGIADRYDNNPVRFDIPKDEAIASLCNLKKGRLAVLDLACGTGNYLQRQIDGYRGFDIAWYGLDKSPEMLERARAKKLAADLHLGDAQTLPYADASLDYVKLRFAYHHFEDKFRAFAEIHRVLTPGGVLSIENISRDQKWNWWVHRYFPAALEIDRERFLTSEELALMLSGIGFEVQTEEHTTARVLPYRDIIAEAKNRDISQLNLISEAEYEAGVRRLEDDAAVRESITAELTFLNVTGVKGTTVDTHLLD
jgi:SAM-dependent methyltransferase